MSNFPILDLVVGMIFIYFMLSIISSSAVEIILTMRDLRARLLSEWLLKIFDKKVTVSGKTVLLGQAIMDHCAITALSKKGRSTSYIDAKNFTSALIEKLTYNESKPASIARNIDDVIQAIEKTDIVGIELKRALLNYANDAKDTYRSFSNKTIGELELFRNKVEHWYDTSMERVSGTFKTKYTRFWTFAVALITALALNADSISIAKYLYNNPESRTKLAAQANKEANDSTWRKALDKMKAERPGDSADLEQIKNNISARVNNIKTVQASLESALPIGWNSREFNDSNGFSWLLLLSKICGLAATILAIMMGAPFWFDVLNKISNMRGTGKKPAETTDATNAGLQAAAMPININVNTNKDEEAEG